MHASRKVAKIATRTLEKIQKWPPGVERVSFGHCLVVCRVMQSGLGNVYGRVRHEKMNCCFLIFPGGLVNLRDK